MHAIRHYQYHHISLSSPRYQEYSDILSKFEDNVGKLETDSTDTFDPCCFHDWLEQKQVGWSINFGNET